MESAIPEFFNSPTVHKHRNLLANAPKHLHDELTEDYRDMIYAETKAEVEKHRGNGGEKVGHGSGGVTLLRAA